MWWHRRCAAEGAETQELLLDATESARSDHRLKYAACGNCGLHKEEVNVFIRQCFCGKTNICERGSFLIRQTWSHSCQPSFVQCVCVFAWLTGSCKASLFRPLRKVGHSQVCRIQEGKPNTAPVTTTFVWRIFHTHTQVWTSWLPSVNRCFLLRGGLHATSHTLTQACSERSLAPLQVDLGARCRGSPTLWFSRGVPC